MAGDESLGAFSRCLGTWCLGTRHGTAATAATALERGELLASPSPPTLCM